MPLLYSTKAVADVLSVLAEVLYLQEFRLLQVEICWRQIAIRVGSRAAPQIRIRVSKQTPKDVKVGILSPGTSLYVKRL